MNLFAGKRKGRRLSRLAFSLFVLGLIWCYVTVISVLEIHSIDSYGHGLPQRHTNESISQLQNQNRYNGDTTAFKSNTDITKITAGFVHVGKTGGSTLSSLLRYGCHSFLRPKHKQPCRVVPNETITSKLVHTYYHIPDFHKLPKSTHQIYIMTTRDVLDRTVSAFLYNHPKNIPYYDDDTISEEEIEKAKIAYQCFPSLEAFASLLNRGNSTECDYPYRHNVVDSTNCSELACAVSKRAMHDISTTEHAVYYLRRRFCLKLSVLNTLIIGLRLLLFLFSFIILFLPSHLNFKFSTNDPVNSWKS